MDPKPELTLDRLPGELYSRFPQLLEPRFRSLHADVCHDLPFTLYGTVFVAYISDFIVQQNAAARREIASLLEDMAISNAPDVGSLLCNEVLPAILKTQSTLDTFWPDLGPRTRGYLRLAPPRILGDIELPGS